MDKFNALYNEIIEKLGAASDKNQYSGKSIQFILEDIERASKLVSEESGDSSFLKSFIIKIKDGVCAAMSKSVDDLMKFWRNLRENEIVKKVFRIPETDDSVQRYCAARLEGDMFHLTAPFPKLAEGTPLARFVVDLNKKNRVQNPYGNVAIESVLSVVGDALIGLWNILKALCYLIFLIVKVVAWIIKQVSEVMYKSAKWVFLKTTEVFESVEDNTESNESVKLDVTLPDGKEKTIVANNGKTFCQEMLELMKDCISTLFFLDDWLKKD